MALTQEEIRELEKILDDRAFALPDRNPSMASRRAWLARNRPTPTRKPKKKRRATLTVVVPSPRLPAPLGFEEYAIMECGHWPASENNIIREQRARELWRLWLRFLGDRCPTKDTDPEWTYRYESPDVYALLDRLPELAEVHRRRFGTDYCRLVRSNGLVVVASAQH